MYSAVHTAEVTIFYYNEPLSDLCQVPAAVYMAFSPLGVYRPLCIPIIMPLHMHMHASEQMYIFSFPYLYTHFYWQWCYKHALSTVHLHTIVSPQSSIIIFSLYLHLSSVLSLSLSLSTPLPLCLCLSLPLPLCLCLSLSLSLSLSTEGMINALKGITQLQELGQQLNISEDKLSHLLKSCQSGDESREMITYWIEYNNDASWEKLANALVKIGENKVAEKIVGEQALPRALVEKEDLPSPDNVGMESMSHACNV